VVEIKNLTFQYNNHPPVFKNFNWRIGENETWSVLGSSGSGKTTLLHLLASLKRADGGSIEIKGKSLLRPRPETGLIMQNHGLLPWATVQKNVELGFNIRRFYRADGKHSPVDFNSDKKTEKKQISLWLEKMGIGELKDRYPHEISGGQQQRTAIARTLIMHPDLLLMDEPFSSLDSPTRKSLQELVIDLHRKKEYSRIIVTHSIEEALIMGSKILILQGGGKDSVILDNPDYMQKEYFISPAYEALLNKINNILGENFEKEEL